MNLKEIIVRLEAVGRLTRVKSVVDPVHELAGICQKFEGGKAILFEKVKGYNWPIFSGLWWNRDNIASLFDTNAQELPFVFARAVSSFNQNPIEPIIVANPACQQVFMPEPDLYKIPTPTLALLDGGPYYSNAVFIAKDPDTGVRNTSIHRMQVIGKDRAAFLLDVGRHLRDYYERAEARGLPLEVTINIGVDPSVYVAAITPSVAAPIDTDELGIAAALRGQPVQLSQSRTVAVEGIANAQLVIEAELLPNIRVPEGPFGEVSGYYAQQDERWCLRVKAISHQHDPIIHSLHPGVEVWNSVGLTAEANIFQIVSKQIPGLKRVYLSPGGCGFYGAIIQIDVPRRGMAKNAILSTFAAFPPLNMVIAVNSDIDIQNPDDIFRAMATRCVPDEDVIIIPKCFGHELNPATDKGFGAKMGFDCTVSWPVSPEFERVQFQEVDLSKFEIVE